MYFFFTFEITEKALHNFHQNVTNNLLKEESFLNFVLPSCFFLATPSKRPPPVEESPKDTNPPSAPAGAMAWSTDTNNNDHGQARAALVKEPSTDRSSDTESCDDSDPSDTPDSGSDRVRLLRKMNSEGMTPQEITPLKDRAR